MKKDGLKGVSNLLDNMNKEIREIQGRGKKGLRRAAIMVEKDSQKLCPVITGNLKGSSYTKMIQGSKPVAEVGYTAEYAPTVHENPNAGQTPRSQAFNRKGKKIASTVGQWKFLEKALKDNRTEIIKVIVEEARKK